MANKMYRVVTLGLLRNPILLWWEFFHGRYSGKTQLLIFFDKNWWHCQSRYERFFVNVSWRLNKKNIIFTGFCKCNILVELTKTLWLQFGVLAWDVHVQFLIVLPVKILNSIVRIKWSNNISILYIHDNYHYSLAAFRSNLPRMVKLTSGSTTLYSIP